MANWIEANNGTLRYDLTEGSGPTVVLIHEMGGSLESWDEVVSILKGKFRLLRYDTKGAGLSEKLLGVPSIEDHVLDLDELIKTLGISEPVCLVGIAVGAAIGIAYSVRHPDKVSALVAFAPACGVTAARQQGTVDLARKISVEGNRPAAENLLNLVYTEDLRTDLDKYHAYRARWLASDSRSLGGILEMLAMLEMDADLADLKVRVLLVGGALDPLRPPQELARLSGLVPNSQCVIVPTGHMVATHSPLLTATLIEQFINSNALASTIAAEFLSAPENWIGDQAHAA